MKRLWRSVVQLCTNIYGLNISSTPAHGLHTAKFSTGRDPYGSVRRENMTAKEVKSPRLVRPCLSRATYRPDRSRPRTGRES
jgi:hypothetical protein